MSFLFLLVTDSHVAQASLELYVAEDDLEPLLLQPQPPEFAGIASVCYPPTPGPVHFSIFFLFQNWSYIAQASLNSQCTQDNLELLVLLFLPHKIWSGRCAPTVQCRDGTQGLQHAK